MDIQKMQAVMLSQGMRIADDDPIFSIVALVEIAVNETNAKHLERIHIISDPILSAVEILTMGRQFLSCENEQILDEVNSIKGSIATITQQITNNTIQDKDRFINVIKTIDASLLQIAHSIRDSKSVLEARNEAFLIRCIKEITSSVQQVTDIEKLLESAAKDHIEDLIRPVLQQMTEQVKMLSNKDTAVMSLIKKTNDTQNKLTANVGLACLGVGLVLVLTFSAGYLLRPVLGS